MTYVDFTDWLDSKGAFHALPDEAYLRLRFRQRMGYALDLSNPQTFCEKLQWLKLHDRKPEYSALVDKYAVKQFAAHIVGDACIVPTLGVWEAFDDIVFDALPRRFVLKTTHDSGSIVRCKDKNTWDMRAAKKKLEKSLRTNYYLFGREWVYKNVKPRIIAEPYLSIEESDSVPDYKLFCFGGRVMCTLVCTERFSQTGVKKDFYDREWRKMKLKRPGCEQSRYTRAMPKTYETMLAYAEKLSQGIPFVRVDFYEVNGKLYFGELTFFPSSGMEGFEPKQWDAIFGAWIAWER